MPIPLVLASELEEELEELELLDEDEDKLLVSSPPVDPSVSDEGAAGAGGAGAS